MSVKALVGIALVASMGVLAPAAVAQQGPPPYGMNVSVDVAKKAAAAAVAEARKNNWSMAVAVSSTCRSRGPKGAVGRLTFKASSSRLRFKN